MAFTHGIALPLLFPICLMGLINMYICEKLQFAYFYREPPMFDNRLNDRALSILFFAPIMMLLFGYWQLSNRQMFHNENVERYHQNLPVLIKHQLIDFENGLDYTVIILFAIPTFIFHRKIIDLLHRFGAYLRIFKKYNNS